MAKTPTPAQKARRSLLVLLAVLVALLALAGVGVATTAGSMATKFGSLAPKLGLDLSGGSQIILQAVQAGKKPITQDQLDQSVTIIRQRVDAAGITEAQISTSPPDQVIVSIPGPLTATTKSNIESSAKMDFRAVLESSSASSASVGKKSTTPYSPPASLSTTPTAAPTNGSDLSQVTPALAAIYKNYSCSQDTTAALAPASKPLVTCSTDGTTKYLLGPIEVQGKHISGATSGLSTTSQGVSTGTWEVNLSFDGTGTQEFSTVSSRLVSLTAPRNEFAIVLDGKVVESPYISTAVTNGTATITGNFDATSAKTLADQLKFGALPVSFKPQSVQTISATLGATQLLSGLLAGLIGLVLVVLYSLFQYRTLGLVTVLSLVNSAVITYLVIDFLSWHYGYRLSLAGVAGLIVSIGITADSFIVYFERIRDELREGKSLSGAVEAGWRRAIRTVLASDTVNLLAAAVLFFIAIGDVKGFALTLGITTIIDVLTVSLFTHPVLQLLSRRAFFADGHRLSGLDPTALGAVYRGRAQFRSPAVAATAAARSRGEAVRRQTIAERKAQDAAGSTDRGQR